jgi:hypothetical protein
MVWPVAFPLEAFLTRAGITALGTAATSEGIKSLQNQGTVNPGVAKEAFMRTLMGPTTEILNRTTDTPSGKVFAPTGEVIESNQIPGMAPAEQPQGLPGLLPPQQEKQVEGMSQASPPTKDKGFTMPTTEDMSILYKVEDGEPKYKYPTEEEIKKYINEENEFWEQNAQRANEKYPELSSNNLPKLVEADKHFGAAAHSFQDFKNSKLIYMKPQEYLDLTRKFRPAEGEEKLGSKMNVKNIENILQQGKELANIPMLYVKKVGDGFEINGQEGIHRAKAFNNLGYDRIPVVIEGATKKEREELKDFIPSSIQSEDGEVLLTKPEDFYSVIDKKPLINKEQPTETVPTQEDNKFNIAYELDPKLIDEMLVARGGTKKFQERMKTMAAPMPASTKDKMFPILADKLMAKYKFDQTDKYEKFEDIPKDELEILQKKYRTKLNAIDYIVSSVYDVIGGKKSNTERDTIFAVDNDGLPVAAVKLGSGEISGAKAKKTIAIEEAGSVFPEAMDRVLEDVKKLAKERGLKFIVAEDLTTDEGYEAFKKRGFKPTTSEKYKMFKGKKIRRPNGKVAYQKNLVFELEPKEKNTSKSAGSLIDKPLSDE